MTPCQTSICTSSTLNVSCLPGQTLSVISAAVYASVTGGFDLRNEILLLFGSPVDGCDICILFLSACDG